MSLKSDIDALRAESLAGAERAGDKGKKKRARRPKMGWPTPEALDREEAVLSGRVRRPLVTLRVAAAHFGMSVEGLRRRIHLDGCPHVKVGQELRLDLGKVEAFYGRGQEGAASGAPTAGKKEGAASGAPTAGKKEGAASGAPTAGTAGAKAGRRGKEDKAGGTPAVRKTDVSDRVHGRSLQRAGA